MIPFWLRLAWRSMINNRRFSILFSINLAVGLCGFVALSSFSTSFQKSLQQRSKDIVGADIVLTANLPFDESDIEAVKTNLPNNSQVSILTSFYSMARTADESRLVRIIAIDNHFPFYGQIKFQDDTIYKPSLDQSLSEGSVAWVDPELLIQLNTNLSQPIKVGNATFTMKRSIREDSTGSAIGFNLSPRIYIHQDYIADTGLIQTGSRIRYSLLGKVDPKTDITQITEKLKKIFPEERKVRVQSHIESSDQLGRLVSYLNDYLSLAAVVALLLAGLGGGYLHREFLNTHLKEIAVMMTLGARFSEARNMLVAHLLGLGLMAAAIAILFGIFTINVIPSALGELLPQDLDVSLQGSSIAWVIIVGVLSSLLFAVPALKRVKHLKPSMLFQDSLEVSIFFNVRTFLTLMPLSIFFFGVTALVTHSWFVASIFFLALFVSALSLSGLSWAILKILDRRFFSKKISVKLAIRQLRRHPLSTTSSVIALGLGVTLTSLIPQIGATLRQELLSDPSKRPDLFLFDIQEEQVQQLTSTLNKKSMQLEALSPVIRARLTMINDQDMKQNEDDQSKIFETRESERQERFQNRTQNLSTRLTLNSSERILTGRPFSGRYDWSSDKLPELSVEQRFARRLNISIGDTVTFDVQGVEVTGTVINFRTVKWSSFLPNFFILVQPGVLDDAPKSFLAAINGLNAEEKARLQTELVREFPNISMIDVTKAIDRITTVSARMLLALQIMAVLSLISGMFVLFSICQQQAFSRKWEFTLSKVIGMTPRRVLRSFLIEIGLIVTISVSVGSVMATGVAMTLSYFVFNRILIPDWTQLAIINIVIATSGIFLAWLGAAKILNTKPAALLNE